MKYAVDASVAIKWTVEEDGHADARRLVSGGHDLVGPDFVLLEAANILWKKQRRKEIGPEQATQALADIEVTFTEFFSTSALAARALELSIELDHPVYDCLYLAVAERAGCPIVSDDQRLLLVAGKTSTPAVALVDVQE